MFIGSVFRELKNSWDHLGISEHVLSEILRLIFKDFLIYSLDFELQEVIPGVLFQKF